MIINSQSSSCSICKSMFIVIAGIAIVGFLFYAVISSRDQWVVPPMSLPVAVSPVPSITNFEECAAAGHQVMLTYPQQCLTQDGKMFTEYIGNVLEKDDLIHIDTPRPKESITSPLLIEGEARGYWFFEASFPVRLFDGNGNELAVKPAQAQGEWMTEEFVPFHVILEFEEPATDTGMLVLEKDNPSGLPEHADELVIPVRFR